MEEVSKIVHSMLLGIADFFYYMAHNQEERLYYVIPIRHDFPYAYQHSTIRDVATVCDILDLVQFFKTQKTALGQEAFILFETMTGRTLKAYHDLYQREGLPHFSEGNIGDIGFFLLLLQKCQHTFPTILPETWTATRSKLIKLLLERQNNDGSFRIFFDPELERYAKSGEAFYLPEALIGLILCDEEQEAEIKKGVTYCCQEKLRRQNLASDVATFYANWQFQLLYHWFNKKHEGDFSQEENHLIRLLDALQNSRIAHERFGSDSATVEVACYMEGLAHARSTLQTLKPSMTKYEKWFEKEIHRSLQFLYEVQNEHIALIKGGFAHSRNSNEARIDVAGHVFNGLSLISK